MSKNIAEYYKYSQKIPLASRASFHVRRKMFDLFMARLQPKPGMQILDLGATADISQRESNYFELLYPYKNDLTYASIEPGAAKLEEIYPGIHFQQIIAGEPLPFENKKFDIVFCNAVIEHVGGHDSQKKFIAEILRVAKHFFITTPNRYFPIEMHTGIPLLHYLPPTIYRPLYRQMGQVYFSKEENLNLLSSISLKALFPAERDLHIENARLCGVPSNLVAWG